jgi:hypothetical protein
MSKPELKLLGVKSLLEASLRWQEKTKNPFVKGDKVKMKGNIKTLEITGRIQTDTGGQVYVHAKDPKTNRGTYYHPGNLTKVG